MEKIEIREKIKNAEINRALGLFILVFGIIVIIAMAFANTFVEKMTDLTAGLVLTLIGGGMMWKSIKTLNSLK